VTAYLVIHAALWLVVAGALLFMAWPIERGISKLIGAGSGSGITSTHDILIIAACVGMAAWSVVMLIFH
jgi:hypothetical protein